jgi:hypothetical protein
MDTNIGMTNRVTFNTHRDLSGLISDDDIWKIHGKRHPTT